MREKVKETVQKMLSIKSIFDAPSQIEKLMTELNGTSNLLDYVASTLKSTGKTWEEKKDKAANLLLKVAKLYQQDRATVGISNAMAVTVLKAMVAALSGDVKVEDLELRTMPDVFIEENNLRGLVAELQTDVANNNVCSEKLRKLQK